MKKALIMTLVMAILLVSINGVACASVSHMTGADVGESSDDDVVDELQGPHLPDGIDSVRGQVEAYGWYMGHPNTFWFMVGGIWFSTTDPAVASTIESAALAGFEVSVFYCFPPPTFLFVVVHPKAPEPPAEPEL